MSVREGLSKFGKFLSGMVMPNIGAFIAWGFLTALFIETGWLPNEQFASITGPMLSYLIPILIAAQGGYLTGGDRGRIAGAIAVVGCIAGAPDTTMLMGAMAMGPFAGWVIKMFDRLMEGRTPAGFEGIAQSVFRKEEYVEMLSSPSPETHFLRLWTIREALCKALGCGFPRGFPHLYIQNGFTSFFLHRHPLSAQSLALCNSAFVLSACILTKQKEFDATIQEFDFSVFDVSRKFSEDDIQCPAKQQQIHLCSGV